MDLKRFIIQCAVYEVTVVDSWGWQVFCRTVLPLTCVGCRRQHLRWCWAAGMLLRAGGDLLAPSVAQHMIRASLQGGL